MEISLLSDPEFVAASKDYVCVRLETYESESTQQRIRSLLDGKMKNTAFVVYSPDASEKLTRSGRSPYRIFGGGDGNNASVIAGMEKIASRYPQRNTQEAPLLQDFDSFKQALNVAAADQRLLVLSIGAKPETVATLRKVANHPELAGRLHFDQVGDGDRGWQSKVGVETLSQGIVVIQADRFGQTGRVVQEVALNTSSDVLSKTLVQLHAQYRMREERQHYGNHIRQGRREGINYHNSMPHGEDHDGDGKIDSKRGKRRPSS
ncbi:hypothetical protein [Rubritalea marina]|uniref:hypothetical protein n=1 Tax=Rubritalea marina TaxID=361055 RepID=UPI0003662B68|nr:hypothetical protein [Rubritalea marina]